MEKQLFEKLISSAKQAQDISKGKEKPSRVFTFKPEEIAQIRKQLSLSQGKFADQLGIPISTLRNWEQGRTIPDAPAQTLLRIVHKRPNILSEVADETNIIYGSKSSSIRFQTKGRLKASKVGRVQLVRAAKKKSVRH
jgi:putative transcriptional regulator